MSFIRRTWTPQAADRWSKEDVLAAAFSVLSYLTFMLGSALALLARLEGFLLLLIAALCAGAMYWIIDPKLRAVSADYEAKQKNYLKRVEGVTRWEKSE